MKKTEVWVILSLVMVAMAMIPITALVASSLQKGNPEIVYVDAELSIPEEYTKLEGTPGNETVYALTVKAQSNKILCFGSKWYITI